MKALSRIGLLCWVVLTVIGGCGVETDGPPRAQQQGWDGGTAVDPNNASTCKSNTGNRKPVSAGVLNAFHTCCDGSAHWIPSYLIPKSFHDMLEKNPNTGMFCVPDDFVKDPDYTPKKCTSLFGFAGACISTCIPQVKNADVPLPQDICPPGQLCSPCFDPRTLVGTGACKMGKLACGPPPPDPSKMACRDYAPTMDLTQFAKCCPEGRAHCAGPNLVSEEEKGRLGKCADGKSYCVPDEFLRRGGKFTPPKCRSVGNTEGRCLSVCVPEVASQKKLLPVSTCRPDQRCVPCYDPRTEKDTGACSQGYCDKGPQEPPPSKSGQCKDFDPTMDLTQFTKCCPAGKAHCAGEDLVPDKDRKRLSKCADGKSYCVPDAILSRFGKYTPPTCTSVNNAEGRCVSICVPEVEQQKDQLPVGTCKPDERCVPCYDPRTGMGTGACATGYCEKGPKNPPKLFETCGPGNSSHAYCVPSNLIPPKERHNFDNMGCIAPRTCRDPAAICVPKKVMDAGTTFSPKRCKNNLWALAAAFKNLSKNPIAAFQALLSSEFKEGRCLSKCIPRVRPMANMLQKQSCDTHEVCVPCIDPTKLDQGKISTGACDR